MSVYLFDIDGTLLSGLGPYEFSLSQAIQEEFGKRLNITLSRFHGLTDRRILRDILKFNSVQFNESQITQCLEKFGKVYQPNQEISLIPGVKETINALQSRRDLLGIVTGNVEEMARKKLEYFGLNQYFLFGGFGQESYERGDLVESALSQAILLGWNRDRNNVYLVGDTPRDMQAAHRARVNPIATTTGNSPKEALLLEKPMFLIDNLQEIITLTQ